MAECKHQEERGASGWKRFHPLRAVRRMFRRKQVQVPSTKKSWSTSELQEGKPEVASTLKIGFSVSHDSIFSPEDMSGEPLSSSAGSSLTVHHMPDMVKDELFLTLHQRRDLNDSVAHSLITTSTESFYTKIKEESTHGASFSNLIKLENSEIFEDSVEQSSKTSIISISEKLSLDPGDLTDMSQSIRPLNHNAAHHKIAIRPKRTYGLPHHRKKQAAASEERSLPQTSEVKEPHMFSNEIGVKKTEFSSSKKVSISSYSSEKLVHSISYKEELSLATDTLNSEAAANSTQVVIKGINSNAINFTEERKENLDENYSATKSENQLFCSCLENSETGKSNSNFSDAFKDKLIDKEKDSIITIKKDQTIYDNLKTNESPQEKSMHQLQSSTLSKNLITKDSEIKDEFHYAKMDLKNMLSKNLEADLIPHKDNFSKSNTKDEFWLRSNSKIIPNQVSSNQSNIEAFESKEQIRSDDFPDSELKPIREPTFKDEKLFFEENSTMRSVKESGIYVSHYSSMQPDLTEARNFETAEDILNQESSWIRSVDMSTRESDVTLNTFESKTNEDILTISVNSEPENRKSIFSTHNKIEKPIGLDHAMAPKPTLQGETTQPIGQLASLKSTQKQEMNTGNAGTTSFIYQKRLSVEIVPFSQRMKERNYQQVSHAKKELSEQGKKYTKVLEETSSGQKPSNKEFGKVNFRNVTKSSFSENSKEESASEKKLFKSDQLECPVQIRIQNSRICSNVKDLQSSKIELDGVTSEKVTLAHSDKIISPLQGNNIQEKANELPSETSSVVSNKPDEDKRLETEIPDLSCKANSSEEPELLRVFARRSVKQKHCDKEKTHKKGEENIDVTVSAISNNIQVQETSKINKHELKKKAFDSAIRISDTSKPQVPKHELNKKSNDTVMQIQETSKVTKHELNKKSNDTVTKIHETSNPTKHELKKKSNDNVTQIQETSKVTKHEIKKESNDSVPEIQETSKVTKHELKKKSKSFCEKMTRAVSPLKEMNLISGEISPKPESSSESNHPRQRLASVSDIQRTPGKEDLLGEPPSWLQLAQQRRELREQRERMLLGGSPNSFMDPSSKPARSSKVWDMVNNFQKLQMT